LTGWLGALALASGALHVRAEYAGPRWQVYACKPATTALILAAAWLATPAAPAYRTWVLAGLACSLAGDVFLMLPGDRFRAGLVSFLAAHLCYVAAFSLAAGLVWAPALLPLAAWGVGFFLWLAPRLGPMRLPAAAYMGAIVAMAWAAGGQWLALRSGQALAAFAGALLFLASDSLLAADRFRAPFRSAKLWILATYYPAQWLIARSVAQT
jgi:uncharacterized membrane protein YhhN